MAKPGMGILLLAVTCAACGAPTAAPLESPATSQADATAGATEPAPQVPAPGPDAGEDTPTEEAAVAADVIERSTGDGIEDGTDSAVTEAAPEATPEMEALVSEVGRLYLSYDYRVDHAERVEGFRPLVTPELFDELATPLPAPVVDTLAAEQRVVTAEPAAVVPVEPGVFEVLFDVTTSSGEPAESVTEPRAVVVVVGADLLVGDVR